MDLNFKINNQIINRLDKQILVNKSVNYVFCNFQFQTSDWDNLNKFAIFKDSLGRAYTQYLGMDTTCQCEVPHEALKGTHFKVTVYGGDLVTTNELTVLLVPSGYTTKISPTYQSSPDIFVELFDKISTKIDKIVYEDGFLRSYVGEKVVSELMLIVDEDLSMDSLNPVQNRVVTNALNGKEDVFDFVERLDITIQNLIGRE